MDDVSYLDLLNFGASQQIPESPLGEQVTAPTVESSASVKAKHIKGKNWSTEEDKVLIEAWANTSLDAVVGTDQSSSCYWDRILQYYNTHKQLSWPERNSNAISCRYNTISLVTSRFCGCVQQIINRNQSGLTIQEKVCMYLSFH
jgi:hypothetical protein